MPDCNVCISSDSYDMAEEWHVSEISEALTEFTCCECQRSFPKGSHQQVGFLKYDGSETINFETCADCVEIHRALSCDGPRIVHCLWEQVSEEIFPEMTRACIAKVKTPRARRYLQERWMKWKGLTA